MLQAWENLLLSEAAAGKLKLTALPSLVLESWAPAAGAEWKPAWVHSEEHGLGACLAPRAEQPGPHQGHEHEAETPWICRKITNSGDFSAKTPSIYIFFFLKPPLPKSCHCMGISLLLLQLQHMYLYKY